MTTFKTNIIDCDADVRFTGGTQEAETGAVRLKNNDAVMTRNAENDQDITLLQLTDNSDGPANVLRIGSKSTAQVSVGGPLLGSQATMTGNSPFSAHGTASFSMASGGSQAANTVDSAQTFYVLSGLGGEDLVLDCVHGAGAIKWVINRCTLNDTNVTFAGDVSSALCTIGTTTILHDNGTRLTILASWNHIV